MAARDRSRSPPADGFQLTLWTVPAASPPASPGKKLLPLTVEALQGELASGAGWWEPLAFDGEPAVVPCDAVCDWRADDAVVRSSAYALDEKSRYPALTLERATPR